jgi:von Willebrand factor A domain-containing protein 8
MIRVFLSKYSRLLNQKRKGLAIPFPSSCCPVHSNHKLCSNKNWRWSTTTVRIGNVEIPLGRPPLGDIADKTTGRDKYDDRWLIPHMYLPSETQSSFSSTLSSTSVLLRHLQWMMAKDVLKQDMLLIGPPGAGECYRRRLVLAYAEMTQKPIEILTISGDITESDLKQRRELVQTMTTTTIEGKSTSTTSVQFVDQAPVRAAKHGRLLLLDGLEKAERNVLPTLNNLLENREMYLEDGSLLMPPHRVNKLLSGAPETSCSSSSSSSWIPVHPDFRVIALAVPSPPFSSGRSLDPPIRSRFQIRRIDNPTSEQLYEQLIVDSNLKSDTDSSREVMLAKSCAVLASAMDNQNQLFPYNQLESIWRILRDFPAEHPADVLDRVNVNNKTVTFEDVNRYFDTPNDNNNNNNKTSGKKVSAYTIRTVERKDSSSAIVTLESTDASPTLKSSTIDVPCGPNSLNGQTSSSQIVHTDGFRRALAAMLQQHGSGTRDILLLSPKGEGKNVLAQEFSKLLGYETHLFALYSEMSTQDLLMRRGTDSTTGETVWNESPLIRAARQGDVCILDGIEKLRPDALSGIQRYGLLLVETETFVTLNSESCFSR